VLASPPSAWGKLNVKSALPGIEFLTPETALKGEWHHHLGNQEQKM